MNVPKVLFYLVFAVRIARYIHLAL